MGGRDQSQMKIKFKKFKKFKSVPKDVPKCHNDDNQHIQQSLGGTKLGLHGRWGSRSEKWHYLASDFHAPVRVCASTQ